MVQSARQAAAETSGAMSGARVAAYLRGEAEEKPASDKILERLAAPQAAVPEPAPLLSPVEAVDERKLEALAKAAEPLPSVAAVPAKAVSEEELRQADEKLASLLKKPGGGV